MEYNQTYYNTPLIRTLSEYRVRVSRDREWFTGQPTNPHMLLVPAGLCYFNKLGLRITNHKLGRDDTISYQLQYWSNNNSNPHDSASRGEFVTNALLIKLIHVAAQITDTFEALPDYYNANTGWSELNGLSIALKTSPRHRIRVYAKTIESNGIPVRTINIYSSNKFFDYANDYQLIRNIIAVVPLLYDANIPETHPAFTSVLKEISLITDASQWLDLAQAHLENLETFNNIHLEELKAQLQNLNKTYANSLSRNISTLNNEIASYENYLKEKYKALQQYQYKVAFLDGVGLSDEDINFIINKRIVKNITVRDSKLYCNIEALCLSYDKPAAENYYNRSLSDDGDNYSKIFKAAFIDESIVLQFESAITIDFTSVSIDARYSSFQQYHNRDALFNPHHYHYNCWGNYAPTITKLISNFDYMQLFMQIKAAIGSLNMTDYTVLNAFRRQMIDRMSMEQTTKLAPCVIWKSKPNERHTLTETIQYLKGEALNETN